MVSNIRIQDKYNVLQRYISQEICSITILWWTVHKIVGL